VVAAVLALWCALLIIFVPVGFLYPKQGYYSETIASRSEASCIYVINKATGTWPGHEEAMRLSAFGSVYFVKPKDLYRSMQDLTTNHALRKQCVMYINLWDYYTVDYEEILKASDYSTYTYLYVTEYSCVMLFE